jgi:hypothetical protein
MTKHRKQKIVLDLLEIKCLMGEVIGFRFCEVFFPPTFSFYVILRPPFTLANFTEDFFPNHPGGSLQLGLPNPVLGECGGHEVDVVREG